MTIFIKIYYCALYINSLGVGKTGSLGPCSRFTMYCSKPKWSPNERIILAKGKLATIHYDFAPRPQRSCFAHPNRHTRKMIKRAEITLKSTNCSLSLSLLSSVIELLTWKCLASSGVSSNPSLGTCLSHGFNNKSNKGALVGKKNVSYASFSTSSEFATGEL